MHKLIHTFFIACMVVFIKNTLVIVYKKSKLSLGPKFLIIVNNNKGLFI